MAPCASIGYRIVAGEQRGQKTNKTSRSIPFSSLSGLLLQGALNRN